MRIDRERGEIHFKLTYFGPGFAGKQTSLQYIWNKTRPAYKTPFQNVFPRDEIGEISPDELKNPEHTRRGRQVWFEVTPLTIAPIAGLHVRLDLQANSGALWNAATRRLSLKGADGVMFVAHSHIEWEDANVQALRMLEQQLAEGVAAATDIPRVYAYNKRDMMSDHGPRDLADLERAYNPRRWPSFATSAYNGEGIFAALKALLADVIRRHAAP